MNRLRDLRLERGWNMRETAKHFDLPYTTYVSYEKGERTPSFDLVCTIAEAYDVSVTYLMGTSELRGSFPKHDDPGQEAGALDDFIARYRAASPELQEAILALLKAAE